MQAIRHARIKPTRILFPTPTTRRESPRALHQNPRCDWNPKRCRRRQEICGGVCGGEEKISSWYRLVSGAALRCTVLPGGRRQITGIILPGDLFGFPGGNDEELVIEAICDGTALVEYPARRVETLAASNFEIAHELFQAVFKTISRLEEQVLVIGRGTAAKKVAQFILYFADYLTLTDDSIMILPLSRYDIADYLTISAETVCRCFTDLRKQGAIELLGPRKIKIIDRDMLENP